MTKDVEKLSIDMIAITKIQKEKIKAIGKFDDDYSDIVERLLKCYEESHPDVAKVWNEIAEKLKNSTRVCHVCKEEKSEIFFVGNSGVCIRCNPKGGRRAKVK